VHAREVELPLLDVDAREPQSVVLVAEHREHGADAAADLEQPRAGRELGSVADQAVPPVLRLGDQPLLLGRRVAVDEARHGPNLQRRPNGLTFSRMLKAEINELLTQIGPGTPTGELFRRYWLPALLAEELEEGGPPVRVKVLSERLIAFRNEDGEYGLVDEFCAHRGASLWFGKVEDCGSAAPTTAGSTGPTGSASRFPPSRTTATSPRR